MMENSQIMKDSETRSAPRDEDLLRYFIWILKNDEITEFGIQWMKSMGKCETADLEHFSHANFSSSPR